MRHQLVTAAALTILALGLLALANRLSSAPAMAAPTAAPTPADEPTDLVAATDPAPTVPRPTVPERAKLGSPWGSVTGLLQFRGNPTHTWYGTGPLPTQPEPVWRYPDAPMCSTEVIGKEQVTAPDPETGEEVVVEERDITKRWCGTGWTGQPLVWERPDGVTEVIVGGYDGAVHFVDGATGQPTRTPFRTGAMIKGTATLDPDGFPLLYVGSRDNHFRAIALDRDVPTELWRMGPHPQRVWNNDWDGNASIVDGILYEGGEDSWFRAVELHRTRDAEGLVQLDPVVLFEMPGWTDEQFQQVGDRNTSIENSVAVDVERERVWFANSGGRVVALDISRIREGVAPVILDFLAGDDIDASIVIDHDGTVVVAAEYERKTARAREVGQLFKLDPERPDAPLVWSLAVPDDPRPGVTEDDGGIWSTPALYAGHLYVTTHPGDLVVVDAATGVVTHTERFGYHEWSSPIVVDDTLLVARCLGGALLAFSLDDPARPLATWLSPLPSGACIESTPASWAGSIYVGSRDGYLYGWR